jgi:predicted anti-sigma-YlaC factor YlaD
MSCKHLQEAIALYADDALAENVRADLDVHLAACPVCRARLAQFQALQNDFRAMAARAARPALPTDLLNSVRNAVAVELKTPAREKQSYIYSEGFRRWLQFQFMPYAVGTVASLFLTISLLLTLLSTRDAVNEAGFAAAVTSTSGAASSSVLLAANNNPLMNGESLITPAEYAALRLPVANESPSVNPTGALVALTKSIVRGKMHDEEVVVVADVFGNGLARISEVVEAPRNQRDLQALEKALQQDPNDPAFLPAVYDKRSDVVRVVLKIQHVDVVEQQDSAPNN